MLLDKHQGLDLSGGKIAVVPKDQVQKNLLERQQQRDRAAAR